MLKLNVNQDMSGGELYDDETHELMLLVLLSTLSFVLNIW